MPSNEWFISVHKDSGCFHRSSIVFLSQCTCGKTYCSHCQYLHITFWIRFGALLLSGKKFWGDMQTLVLNHTVVTKQTISCWKTFFWMFTTVHCSTSYRHCDFHPTLERAASDFYWLNYFWIKRATTGALTWCCIYWSSFYVVRIMRIVYQCQTAFEAWSVTSEVIYFCWAVCLQTISRKHGWPAWKSNIA